jgi:methionyl-tRNA formyltransferase
LRELEAWAPELGVTAAFGKILKKALLELPARGCWNVHTSLLPRHRGAAPVPAAILAGDAWTGVSLFQLDRGMDTGPLLLQAMTPIGPKETAGALTERLASLGAELLIQGIDAEERSSLPRRPQPPLGATHAPPLEKEDGRIDWRRPVEQIDRWVRAVTPWPGAFTHLRSTRLAILEAEPVHALPEETTPGTMIGIQRGVEVACLPGSLRLVTVQQEGRKPQPAEAWARGARVEAGARLTPHPADRPA